MSSPRGIGVCVLALGFAFACGSFGEAGDPVSPPGADGGPTADGGSGNGNGDASTSPGDGAPPGDAAVGTGWCADKMALFCADFEHPALPAGFADDYSSGDPISLALTAGPDRKLAVTLPNNGTVKSSHVLEKSMTFPAEFEVSFELTASTNLPGQFIEIVDVQRDVTQARLTATINDGIVEATLHVPSQMYQDTIEIGAVSTTPTRYTMKLTATALVVRRNEEQEQGIAIVGSAQGVMAGPCSFTTGVYYVNQPKDGSFELDDVIVRK